MENDRFAIALINEFLHRYMIQTAVPEIIREVIDYNPNQYERKIIILTSDEILLELIANEAKDVMREAIHEIVTEYYDGVIRKMPPPDVQICELIMHYVIEDYARSALRIALDEIVRNQLVTSHMKDLLQEWIDETIQEEANLLALTMPLSEKEEIVLHEIEIPVIEAFAQILLDEEIEEVIDTNICDENETEAKLLSDYVERTLDAAVVRYLLVEWASNVEDFSIRIEAERMVDQSIFDIFISNLLDISRRLDKIDPGSILELFYREKVRSSFANASIFVLQQEIEGMEDLLDKEEETRKSVVKEKRENALEIQRLAKEIQEARQMAKS